MTDYNVIQLTDEQKNAGAFVHAQGMATVDGFGRISKRWYDQTVSYDDANAQLFNEKRERHDIVSDLRDVEFEATDNGVTVCVENECYVPTDWAFRQIAGANGLDVGTTILNELCGGDLGDSQTLVSVLNNGKRKLDSELMRRFRTYNDGTMRCMVSDSYSPVDNSWTIDVVREVVPGGRISHFKKSDCDNIVLNVLVPDSLMPFNGREYGGGISLRNSEIGRYTVFCCPFGFDTICMNGNIWGKESGIAFSQRHRGVPDLDVLRKELTDCIRKQLGLVEEHNKKLISSRDWIATTSIDRIFAMVTKQHTLTKELFANMQTQWRTHSGETNAFGVVDAITRAAQDYGQDELLALSEIGGELVQGGIPAWERLNVKAGAMTEKEFAKFAV